MRRSRPHGPRPPRWGRRARAGDIRIDGLIEEAAWGAALVLTGFVASEPQEGAPAGERTEVRVLFDDQAVYGFILSDRS